MPNMLLRNSNFIIRNISHSFQASDIQDLFMIKERLLQNKEHCERIKIESVNWTYFAYSGYSFLHLYFYILQTKWKSISAVLMKLF